MLYLGFALAVAALIWELLRKPKDPGPVGLVWVGRIFVFLLCSRTAGWIIVGRLFRPDEMPPGLPLSMTGATWLFAVLCGALGFVCIRRDGRSALLGGLTGAMFSALGFAAYRWLIIAQAWKLLGSFTGTFLLATMPFFLFASCALAATALIHPDITGYRGRVIVSLLLVWYAGAIICHRRLETGWDYAYGQRDIGSVAELAKAGAPTEVGIAWLRPFGDKPYVLETKPAEIDGVDISQKNLVKIYSYLEAHKYRTVFLKPAVKLLRQGWLFWWDSERALKAAALSYPGKVVPAYRGALDLLKGGPETRDRLDILQALSDGARSRKAGFEDVTGSQYIFEGFSGAFARFGNEDQARWWLIKIDNLWPIYEKKIEVTPVESMHDGEVSGSVLFSSGPAEGMLVGLFYVGASTQPAALVSSGTLSDSMLADASGKFRFTYLGPGRYYLGLLGAPEDLSGPIHEVPGVFELSQDTPVAHLPPVLLGR